MRFVPLGLVLLLGSVFAFASTIRAEEPKDVTYRAALADGGEVLLTFTPDLSGVTRAEVRDGYFEWVVPTTLDTLSRRFSRHLYFDPPIVVTDGQFELSIPDQLYGMARDAVRIDGSVAGTTVSGTATLVAHVYPSPEVDLDSVPWSSATIIDTPPAADDAIYRGHIDGRNGVIELSLNADGNLTSLTLDNVVASSCFDAPRTFSLHMFFDPPVSASDGVHELIGNELVPLDAAWGVAGGTVAGEISIAETYFGPQCIEHLPWTAEAAAPPTAAATPRAALPVSGSGGEEGGRSGAFAGVAFAGTGGLLALAAAFRRRERDA
jgi:hypothetical protein